MLEYRTFKMEIRGIEPDAGSFEGYASVFNELIPAYNEIVRPGAFKQTLKHNKGKVPILWDHWPSDVIGVGLSAEEDDRGLLVQGQLELDVQKGKEARSLMALFHRVGRPMGLSIGFETMKAINPDRADGKPRELTEIKLWEYSPTAFQANEPATVSEIRNALRLLRNRGIISRDEAALGLNGMEADRDAPEAKAHLHLVSVELDRVLTRLRTGAA